MAKHLKTRPTTSGAPDTVLFSPMKHTEIELSMNGYFKEIKMKTKHLLESNIPKNKCSPLILSNSTIQITFLSNHQWSTMWTLRISPNMWEKLWQKEKSKSKAQYFPFNTHIDLWVIVKLFSTVTIKSRFFTILAKWRARFKTQQSKTRAGEGNLVYF